jgi:hypothetical protein
MKQLSALCLLFVGCIADQGEDYEMRAATPDECPFGGIAFAKVDGVDQVELACSLPGPQGAQGEPGANGEDGADGDAGPQGPAGADGSLIDGGQRCFVNTSDLAPGSPDLDMFGDVVDFSDSWSLMTLRVVRATADREELFAVTRMVFLPIDIENSEPVQREGAIRVFDPALQPAFKRWVMLWDRDSMRLGLDDFAGNEVTAPGTQCKGPAIVRDDEP